MNTASRECIWKDQCGEGCLEPCGDYTPADDTEENEKYYADILRENVRVYERLVREYSDRR